MKKLIILLFVIIVFVSHNAVLAQTAPKEETQRLTQLLQELEGTYQIQIINSRKEIAYNLSLMDIIVAQRHQTEVVYYQLKENVRVKILPFSEINKENFVRLERIKHIAER